MSEHSPDCSFSVRPAAFPGDLAVVLEIFREYVHSPTASLDYQGFEAEFASLPGKYALPAGVILLAWREQALLGCAALRPVDALRGEMKRVYVRPAARGQGVGRQLVEAVLSHARQVGYRQVCLDVLPEFATARALYQQLGFQPAPPVTHNPVPGTAFLALDLL